MGPPPHDAVNREAQNLRGDRLRRYAADQLARSASSVSGAETPALRHGEEAPSPVCVRYCLHTAGPAGIYACGAAAIPKSPMLVSDWLGLPIQQ